jgi:hypothetical protein
MYIPDDFDFDCHMEYVLEKCIRSSSSLYSDFKKITKKQVDKFIKNPYDTGYIVDFLEDFIVFSTSMDVEGYDTIEIIDKKFFYGLDKIEQTVIKVNNEFKNKASLRKEKRELLRLKTKNIDPYGEEEWDEEENESFKIKRFKN